MKTVRELLKTAKVGDVIKFKRKVFGTSVLGLVIENCRIDDHYCVNNKALLLTNFSTGRFWGRVAIRYLDYEAEIVKEVNCVGSGATALACKRVNRNFIGMEKEQKYVDIANKRLSQKTLKEVKNG